MRPRGVQERIPANMTVVFGKLKIFIAVLFIALSYVLLTSPDTAKEYFFPAMCIAAIAVGGLSLTFWFMKVRISSHPIVELVISIILLALGVVFTVLHVDPRFAAMIMGAFAVMLSLERMRAFEYRKGNKGAGWPLLYCAVYWVLAVFITKSAGEQDLTETIHTCGIFLLVVGVLWVISFFFLDRKERPAPPIPPKNRKPVRKGAAKVVKK
jgi:uncharacterized membrane protein HdeD (DUF308 family)